MNATWYKTSHTLSGIAFPSLIGILVDFNLERIHDTRTELFQFQSLIGILVDFNSHFQHHIWFRIKFQSLIGILVDFNTHNTTGKGKFLRVSIPNRDFSTFQPRSVGNGLLIHLDMFQSLIGILVHFNPNYILLETLRAIHDVSIPNRDFSTFQLRIKQFRFSI